MSSSTSSFLPLLFLLRIHQFPSSTTATTRPDIILATCERCAKGDPNVDYALCVQSLESVSKSHHSTLRGLAITAVKLAKANMTQAKLEVKELLKANSMNGRMKSSLKTCGELYSDSVYRLTNSIKAIKSNRFKDANVMISSAVDAPGQCEEAFQEGNITSPLRKENKDLFGLAVIALAITSLLG